MPIAPKKEENFSLGVTALLDDLLQKEDEKAEPKKLDEDKMRRTFQRTQALCEEAAQYFKLMDQEEQDALREAADKRAKAERRIGLNDTLDSINPLNATTDSLYEALEANEAKLAGVKQDIMDLMHRKGGRIPVNTDTPFARTVDFESLGATMHGVDLPPVLDFEKLLEECDRMQAELNEWGGLANTPKGWRRLDQGELGR
eukprot:TRINITY_DN63284_c0_g1_i1.p1 TRINITY_DN63284_c0_g1~~TRINITY_DN63284_c0_g1_i1.p1  ORF type:complete len:201 (+),score=66.70 TRINITY_DN63284_c0_g1_i1:92-694(+)